MIVSYIKVFFLTKLLLFQNRFDIDLSLPWVKRYVHHTFRVALSNFRTQLKKKFLNFSNVEEAKKNKPSEVKTTLEWEYLCSYFSSEEFQKKSQQNNINRSKLNYHHKAGSRSFLSHMESMAANRGLPVDAIEQFEIQY